MRSLERRLDELQHAGPQPACPPPGTRPVGGRLRDVVGGREATCRGTPYWELTTPFERVPGAPAVERHLLGPPLECEVSRNELTMLEPAGTLVMDIETGGFSGTPVFLIGVVAFDQRPLRVEQWLARDYPEEEALLRRLAEWSQQRETWVTFNGKTFDVPFVLERGSVYGVDIQPPRLHVDLLHIARRRWRSSLPDCRLETLERYVLGRPRVGDVPGCDVPDLFHHFIRTGNAGPLRPVLEHNQRDLVASIELLVRVSRRQPAD